VGIAHQSRIEAVNAMRYHLCIDSMPADDVYSLSVEQINRVLTLALNSKFLRVTAHVGRNETSYLQIVLLVPGNCSSSHTKLWMQLFTCACEVGAKQAVQACKPLTSP